MSKPSLTRQARPHPCAPGSALLRPFCRPDGSSFSRVVICDGRWVMGDGVAVTKKQNLVIM